MGRDPGGHMGGQDSSPKYTEEITVLASMWMGNVSLFYIFHEPPPFKRQSRGFLTLKTNIH